MNINNYFSRHVFSSLFFVALAGVALPVIAQKNFDSKQRPSDATGRVSHFNGKPAQLIRGGFSTSSLTSPYRSQEFSKSALTADLLLKQKDPTASAVFFKPGSTPVFIQGKNLGNYVFTTLDPPSVERAAKLFLNEHALLLKITNPPEEFFMKNSWVDDLGKTHVRMQQEYMGLQVWASEIILHFNGNSVESMNGRFIPTPSVSTVTPAVTESAALSVSLEDLKKRSIVRELNEKEKHLLQYSSPHQELIIYHHEHLHITPALAWHFTIRPNFAERWEYFVDAQTGKILHRYNNTPTDGPAKATATDLNGQSRTIDTYQVGNDYFMIDATRTMFNSGASQMPNDPKGALWILDLQNKKPGSDIFHVTSNNNTWNDASSVSAQFNGSIAYEYFRTTHGRNSIDGAGGTIISVVNTADQDGGGMDNAFWNGQAMFYGNGRTGFKPLAGALDVAAHEMSHGVTEKTANLVYEFQSGAMNEHMSDVFGAMCDRDDWKIGEDVTKTSYISTGTLRNMEDPHNGGSSLNDNGWQPAHMNEFAQLSAEQDNGGVHVNSGILNKAFVLYANTVGKETAEKVWYRTLTTYLTRNSQFIDLRLGVIKAAGDLSANANAAKQAFDGVGITDGTGTGGDGTLPPNPGTQFMLIHDTHPQDPNSLYIVTNPVSPANEDFHPISTREFVNKPSVTDDGSIAVCVGTDNKPYAIALNINNPQETKLNDNPDWQNIAVSKDGNRIALISKYQDTSIFVYDFVSQQLAQYILYNPTTANGVSSGNVLYADALEWDYSGEFLVYDAFNKVENSNGSTIEYWDVGFMRVWNNASKTFGDGEIFKLFTNLPEGISIGNPSFAKLATNVLAFDYVDQNSQQIAIIAMNIEKNEGATVFVPNVLGTPNYTVDDKALAFNAKDQDGNDIIGGINMQADKITPSGNAVSLVGFAKWPVWYANGKRVTSGTEEFMLNMPNAKAYPNPFAEEINVNYSMNTPGNVSISLYDMMGRKVMALKEKNRMNKGNYTERFAIGKLPPGVYMIYIRTASGQQLLKLVHAN